MSTQPRTDRRSELLDAALRLIGEGGMRAVTHRAVEQEAGAPHGSTTYYFKNRDQLIEAAVERMAEIDFARASAIGQSVARALAPRTGQPDLEPIADAIIAWIEGDATIQLARFEILVAAGRDPRLRERMDAASRRFWEMVEPVAIAAGSDDPPRDARAMCFLLDGLIMGHLTHGEPDRQVLRAGIRRLLTGEIGPA